MIEEVGGEVEVEAEAEVGPEVEVVAERRGGSDDGNSDKGRRDHFAPPSPSAHFADPVIQLVPEPPRARRDFSPDHRTHLRFEDQTTYRHTSRDERELKAEIEARIEREQQEAIHMIERADEQMKMSRRTHLREDTRLSEREKEEIDEDMDIMDTMRYLDMTYGLVITPAGDRPEVDNGELDSETEEVKYAPDMPRADRLKAETTLPSMRPDIGSERLRRSESASHYMPRAGLGRSRTEPMYDRFRYMPTPMPYPPPPPPAEWSSDEDEHRHGGVIFEETGSSRPRPSTGRHGIYAYDNYDDRHGVDLRPQDESYRRPYTDERPPPIIIQSEGGVNERRRPSYRDDHGADIIIQPEGTGKERRRPSYRDDHGPEDYERPVREAPEPGDQMLIIAKKSDFDNRKKKSKKTNIREGAQEVRIVDDYRATKPSDHLSQDEEQHMEENDVSTQAEAENEKGMRVPGLRSEGRMTPIITCEVLEAKTATMRHREMHLVRKK